MTPEQETALRIGLYVVGWALSIVWPFLLKYVTESAAFNWRMVSGRLLAGALGLLTFLAGDEVISLLGGMSFLAALLAGFGASSAGRNVQRTADAAREGMSDIDEQPFDERDSDGNMIEFAWGIIANAYGGDWDLASPQSGWKEAAERWREQYHKWLRERPPFEPPQHADPPEQV